MDIRRAASHAVPSDRLWLPAADKHGTKHYFRLHISPNLSAGSVPPSATMLLAASGAAARSCDTTRTAGPCVGRRGCAVSAYLPCVLEPYSCHDCYARLQCGDGARNNQTHHRVSWRQSVGMSVCRHLVADGGWVRPLGEDRCAPGHRSCRCSPVLQRGDLLLEMIFNNNNNNSVLNTFQLF